MKCKPLELVQGDVIRIEHEGETYEMEVESKPIADRTAASILLVDDDLRVFKYTCLRDADVTVIRPSFKRDNEDG